MTVVMMFCVLFFLGATSLVVPWDAGRTDDLLAATRQDPLRAADVHCPTGILVVLCIYLFSLCVQCDDGSIRGCDNRQTTPRGITRDGFSGADKGRAQQV